MMIGLGIGPGMGHAGAAGAMGPSFPSSNPNLLLAPEDFSDVVWIKPAVTVTKDYGDVTFPTADRLVMPNTRQCFQNSLTAGLIGSAINNITITPAWFRYSVTAVIDGLSYTYSEMLLWISGATDLRISVGSSGAVVQVSVSNQSGSTSTFGAYGAKLEVGSSFSGYP